MRILVTGGDGFVGQWLVRTLLTHGHEVVATMRGERPAPGPLTAAERGAVRWEGLDLEDAASIGRVARIPVEGVVHLAAVAGSAEAAQDPALALKVNETGTARLLDGLAATPGKKRVVVVSSGEVYGRGEARPRRESDPVDALSPYAVSKAAAERAALGISRGAGLEVIVARPFPHTGPGQRNVFVAPAFLARIRAAQRAGQGTAATGSLDPIREMLDVRDVAEAYLALLERGHPGEVYNVARGEGLSIRELFTRIAAAAGAQVLPESDPALYRPTDIPHLVGDPTKMTAATGWSARRPLDQTLRDLVDAEAH